MQIPHDARNDNSIALPKGSVLVKPRDRRIHRVAVVADFALGCSASFSAGGG
jgi:hypothetical protein